MTDKQKEALFDLCTIVEHIMCDTCPHPSSHCHNCDMINWLNGCRSQFMEEDE